METLSIEVILHSTWTVIAFVFFVGVAFWAWSGKRKGNFDQAARMAMDDDKDLTIQQRRDV